MFHRCCFSGVPLFIVEAFSHPISGVLMGASSKKDRLKDVKVKPPDKSAAVRFVMTEVDLSEVVPPGVVEQSSATIYISRRKPSASGAVATSISKSEWKFDGKVYAERKLRRNGNDNSSPMEAVEYYKEEVSEDETEGDSDSVSSWESDASISVSGNRAILKDLVAGEVDVLKTVGINDASIPIVLPRESNVSLSMAGDRVIAQESKDVEFIKVKGDGICEISIPSGNTAALLKNWNGSKSDEVVLSPNSELNLVTNQMMLANPTITVVDESKYVNSESGSGNTVESRGEVVGKGNIKSSDEFVPGIGFSFLNDLKNNNAKQEMMQVDSNVVTKDDLSYLNNQVIWNESGSVIVESESDSSDEEDLIDDGKGNG